MNDCPLQVEVFEDATSICEGECIEIWAEATEKSKYLQLCLE